MQDEYLTERLPVVRISPSLKERLERVVTTNRFGQMSDHIRFAVETYVMEQEAKQTDTQQPAPIQS